jgi:hypothetical protein
VIYKKIPVEALIILQNQLDALPIRHAKRQLLTQEAAMMYDVSLSTLRRLLRQHHEPNLVNRNDYNQPRVVSQHEMKHYCELIAALKLRTTNKKGRHLSTHECLRLLEEYGVETPDGLIKSQPGLLKRSTVSRYMKRWGYGTRMMMIEPASMPFQAVYSNDCWQFDFSPSDLKKLNEGHDKTGKIQPTLMFASVVDDRSGFCYQEYHHVFGEDVMTALRFLFNAMFTKNHPDCPFQGIPSMIYLDNGPVAKSKLFKKVMAHLNIAIRTHMPKNSDGRRTTARSKGKVERVFRTVKDTLEILYHFHRPDSLIEANEWLRQYLKRYNDMPHRSENHSRLKDWLTHVPPGGFKKMCTWERFCTFAREPEKRTADKDACVSIHGIRYQLDHEMAGYEVTLLWGPFDHDLHVEFNLEKKGPFYPAEGPIQLGTFRKLKKSTVEKRADCIRDLSKLISIPRAALSGEKAETKHLLEGANLIPIVPLNAIPFEDKDPFEITCFKNKIEAKIAIAKYLGHPLAQLTKAQINDIDHMLENTLDKKTVLADILTYFTLSLKDRPGDE